MKKIAILPTLLTLGNGVCGLASVAMASKIHGYPSLADPNARYYLMLGGLFILLAMVFDALDGYAARRTKSASDFGGELDSLCDVISFGVAPAFLLLRLGEDWDQNLIRRVIAVIAGLYLVCTVLRLARFNVENDPDPGSHKSFEGLPSPAAAGCIASLALLRAELSSTWPGLDDNAIRYVITFFTPLAGLLAAVLMVSNVPYSHVNKAMGKRRNFGFIVQAVLVVAIIVLVRELAIFLVFWGYALQAPLRHAWNSINQNSPHDDVSDEGLSDVHRPH